MKKISIHFWFLICLVMLSACQTKQEQLLTVSSLTPKPVTTPTIAKTVPTDTPFPTFLPTPTITLFPPYHTKKILFIYTLNYNYVSPFRKYLPDSEYTKIVVYTDGQIILEGQPYRQKILSADEKGMFLEKLENLGFYEIESNQQHDPSDKLYDFGNQYERGFDGAINCIQVNGTKQKKLCIYKPYDRFLVQEMKNVLTFLDNYLPAGTVPYYPDRILLSVQAGRDPYNGGLPKDAIPWEELSVSINTENEKVLYVEGEVAINLYQRYGGDWYVFTQNGKEYTVYILAILPHQEATNLYKQ